MLQQPQFGNAPYAQPPHEVDGVDSLAELALDMFSSWNHSADELWQKLDSDLWELTHNPWCVLQTVSRDRLVLVLGDAAFREKLNDLVLSRKRATTRPSWFQQNHPSTPLGCVAYFSMEFMLSEALPIYSGGLGNVAGDHLKAANDLGVPLVGVGLLYQRGYFHQIIDANGAQRELFPYNDPGQLPITPLRQPNGEWLRLEIPLPGYSVWLRTWQVRVGRVHLYLLDCNDVANFPAHRGITGELYVSDPETRLKQELVLGIGGFRLLTAVGLQPEVCHLNEGHAAFAVLERARTFMEKTGLPFEAALAATRAGNVFTTHTAVAAGFDRFAPWLIERYLGDYAGRFLGIAPRDLLALGRQNPDDPSEYFTMAFLAIRGSGAVGGVSELHGRVSRRLFAPLFPRWPLDEIPVGHVTNGVHMPTWDSAQADGLWTEACGKNCWLCPADHLTQCISGLSDARIWEFRSSSSASLVDYVRRRLSRQLAASGAPAGDVEEAGRLFDPRALIMGFARRFAAYKRPDLLLRDPGRLLRLLTDPERPVQLIVAGKAHPSDEEGKALVRKWTTFARSPEARGHVMFLGDYDMLLAERFVQGVDVWINTPRRPWEASGTSGMKVLVNGGLNISEIDGWWAEAFTPEAGWAFGDNRGPGEGGSPGDADEAGALYDLLEREVIPEFYARDANGVPHAWVGRMRASMSRLTPRFSAHRMVREYVEDRYLPAASAFGSRAAGGGAAAGRIAAWKDDLDRKWPALRFGSVKTETAGREHRFEAEVFLGGLDPDAIRVEIYCDGGAGGASAERHEMKRIGLRTGGAGPCVYRASVCAVRPPADYTARVVPCFEGVSIPLEHSRILWQR
jgi:glycogen phosphorylase